MKVKPVNHAKAAEEFIEDVAHESFHDERLWDLRQKRDEQMHILPEWQELRTRASQIKEHTLANLPEYLEQFEANAKKNGIHVHWAADGAEHNRIVGEILEKHGAKSLIKSKSMVTEECQMREYLEPRGVTVTETDLGERIQQLDNQMPSHIVVPAVHKLIPDVAKIFAEHYHTDPNDNSAQSLAWQQRLAARPVILSADAGMTGGNFVVAETGSFVVCTNEGNADLSATVPGLHIALSGSNALCRVWRIWVCLSACFPAVRWAPPLRSTPRISVARRRVVKCMLCWWIMAAHTALACRISGHR